MSNFSLIARERAMCLDQLDGKCSIYVIRDHLKANGHIATDPDAINQWELDQARAIVQQSRKFRSKTRDIQLEWVHLKEDMEDGSKNEYYRKFGEVTLKEGAYLATYWHEHGEYGFRQRDRYIKPLIKRFGRRAVQRALTFDLPVFVA